MARTKGMLNLSGNLEVNAGAPLDARTVVPTLADLTIASNFQYKYVGMPVVVQATGDMYVLTANDVTVAANWKPVGKTYTAGTNVNISDQNVISATDTTYTAGTGIDITNGVISATGGGGSSYTAGDGIVIEDDEISTDNMPAADMSEIVTPLPSVMSRLPILFDETGTEKVVGWYKYSDGTKKPVYENSFIINNVVMPANTYSFKTLSTDTTIDLVISYTGFWIAGTQMQAIPSPDGVMFLGIRKLDSTSNIEFICHRAGTQVTVDKVCINIRYTKTTD